MKHYLLIFLFQNLKQQYKCQSDMSLSSLVERKWMQHMYSFFQKLILSRKIVAATRYPVQA